MTYVVRCTILKSTSGDNDTVSSMEMQGERCKDSPPKENLHYFDGMFLIKTSARSVISNLVLFTKTVYPKPHFN